MPVCFFSKQALPLVKTDFLKTTLLLDVGSSLTPRLHSFVLVSYQLYSFALTAFFLASSTYLVPVLDA